MSNGTIENDDKKCENCIYSEKTYYTTGEVFTESFPVSMCGNCIHNSSAEDNFYPKENGV